MPTGKETKKFLENSCKHKNDIKAPKGYKLNRKLTNRNHQVYANNDNDVVVSFAGTRKKQDYLTDGLVGLGMEKYSNRIQNEKKIVDKVKRKYNTKGVTLLGNSLGGSLARSSGNKNDNLISHNPGIGITSIGKPLKKNETLIRSNSDFVSGLSLLKPSGQGNKVTLNRPNPLSSHYVSSIGKGLNKLEFA